jgi:branched-chain amino acid transport system permease protein
VSETQVKPPGKNASSSFLKRLGIFRSQSSFSPLLVALGLVAAFVYPLFLGPGQQGSLGIVVIYFIWIILAESWNLVGGYAGLINLGMVAFFGLGSVVTSIVLTAGLGFGVAILASAFVGAVFALILTPTFRLRTDYFAIATLVIPIVLKPVVEYFAGHTNFQWPPGLAINETTSYELGVALTALTIFGIYFMMKSRIGMALRGIGDDEYASATIGVNVLFIKMIALIVSGVIASIAGAYYLSYILAVNSSIFLNLTFSLYPIFMVIIGGIGTFEGPIVGALLFSAITYEVNTYFPSSDIEVLVFSIVIMAVAVLLPKGLVPSIRKFVISRRQHKPSVVANP